MNPLMRNKISWGGPTVPIRQAQQRLFIEEGDEEEEENLQIAQLCLKKKEKIKPEQAESVVPIAGIDPMLTPKM